jgi:hypothetical protein
MKKLQSVIFARGLRKVTRLGQNIYLLCPTLHDLTYKQAKQNSVLISVVNSTFCGSIKKCQLAT